jgi:hypothetical protein
LIEALLNHDTELMPIFDLIGVKQIKVCEQQEMPHAMLLCRHEVFVKLLVELAASQFLRYAKQ